jgi:hypothetical protein
MRRFTLTRTRPGDCPPDTPIIADGVEYSDGVVAIRWFGVDACTVVWPSFAAAERGWRRSAGAVEPTWLDER